MKKMFEIPKLPSSEEIDFKKLTEEEGIGDIDQYFTKKELASLSEYEKLRYRNMKKNYEMMIRLGLPAQKPEFMFGPKNKRRQKATDSDSDEEWKPNYKKDRRNDGLPAQKPEFMSRPGKKRKQKATNSDSDEEWKPSCERAKTNAAQIPTFSLKSKNLKKRDRNCENTTGQEKISERSIEVKPAHRYPQRQLPPTNYMYLEVPDDDEFVYCEDCEREYEGECPVHSGDCIYDSKTEIKNEKRALATLPDGLSVQESGIPNAGLGVWSDKFIPNRSRFGPYEGEISKDADKAHATGYAWQIYVNGDPSHFIDAYNKSKSNWMRYVNCARNEAEQNLIAYQYKGQIYYRSFKEIQPGTELLVWYGQDYGKDLGIERLDIKSFLKPKFVNGEELYSCPLCKLGFNNERFLSNHMKYKHSTKLEWLMNLTSREVVDGVSYQCSLCRKSFQTEDLAKQHHQLLHDGTAEVEIIKCVNNYLSHRLSSVERNKGLICNRTQKITSNNEKETNVYCHSDSMNLNENRGYCRTDDLNIMYNLNDMIKKNVNNIKLDTCQKEYSQLGSLKVHVNEAFTGDKPYKCDVCGKGFSQGVNLQKHMRTHTGDKPYKCDVCGKGFSHSGDLKKHMRTHTGDKPYKCDVCGKGFSRNDHLQTHMRTHTGDKPYKCDVCGKGFSVNHVLQTHIRTHTGDKP